MITATVVLLLALAFLPRLQRRSAAERHLLWAASLGAAALLPLLTLVMSPWRPSWAGRALGFLSPSSEQIPPWSSEQVADIVVRVNGIEPPSSSFGDALPWLWLTGAATAVLMLAVQSWKLTRLVSAARAVPDGRLRTLAADAARALRVSRPTRLLQSDRAIIPLTWGVRRSRVMLPSSAHEWSDDVTRAVLAHELAHVRRRDWLVHMAAELVCVVYWFHPLFWIAKSRLCAEGECAADDEVLRLGMAGADYAACLLGVVRQAQLTIHPSSPIVAMARSSHLQRRLAALLDVHVRRHAVTSSKAVAAVATTILIVVAVAAVTAQGSAVTVDIQTANLPALADAAAASLQRPPTAIRGLRVIGQNDSGGGVTPPEVVEYTTPPLYSDEARARGIEGVVTAEARVEADGRVSAVRVVKGVGVGLDQNALVALRQWRFRPGTRADSPVVVDVEIDIEFSLRNEAVNELMANDMATRVGPGVVPPQAVRMFGLWKRRHAKRGTVVLDVVLLEDGRPKIVRVLQSLDPELDEGAIRNFEQWRFSPALKNGRPVKVRMNAEVHFHG